ncbi:MAG: DNA recombination protein RmuC [Clostridia bacterium]
MTDALLIAIAVLVCVLIALVLILLKKSGNSDVKHTLDNLKTDITVRDAILRQEIGAKVSETVGSLGEMILNNQVNADNMRSTHLKSIDENLKSGQETMRKSTVDGLSRLESRFNAFSTENEQKLENIREMTERRLSSMQTDNNTKLDEMRNIVDEKLQKTLEERISKSFGLVSERLDMVSKGLGEMQALAIGVGDLKKVLTNVKTRGTLGEIQLHALLSEILSNEQYDCNVVTKVGSGCPVEFAVKFPCEDEGFLYLPIDSKFPSDAYSDLQEAYDSADKNKISLATNSLVSRIKGMAKDINTKYLDPPNTTEFAIMFLPTEGLYAEAVKLGMISVLQSAYHVNIAGPSTMAALLNTLQMGFRTFAIQKRSGEVWTVLSSVKAEFASFASVLENTQKRLTQANDELDKLVGVRTRQIQRKLKDVERLGKLDFENSEEIPLLVDE